MVGKEIGQASEILTRENCNFHKYARNCRRRICKTPFATTCMYDPKNDYRDCRLNQLMEKRREEINT